MAKKKRQPVAVQAVTPRATTPPAMDIWDRIAWICLHALVVLVPIAMSNFGPFNVSGVPLTYDQFDISKVFLERGLMVVAIGAWCVGLLVRGGKVRFSKAEWVILAFVAWVALTSVLSIHPPTAIFGKYRRFEGLISFITYGVTFFVALQLADRPARVRSLARSLAIGGFLVAVYGAIQVVGTVSLGLARVLMPVSFVLTVAGTVWLGYVAYMRSGDDSELRRACSIGAVIVFLGGVVFSAGLTQNIKTAIGSGLSSVSIDPVKWGSLPFEAHRAFSTFGNPDLLGGYLIFPWAIALALALTERHRVWRSAYWVFTLLNVFVGITSYVRGAWIGATVSVIALAIAYVRARAGTGMKMSSADKTFVGIAAAAAVGVMIGSSLRPDAVRNVLTRVISIFQFNQGSALTRFQIWEAARTAIAERPIFGWGADTFRLLFPMFKPAEYVKAAGYLSVADNVHNYPLQLASGIGIPGALLLYGLLAVALVVSARVAFSKGTGQENLLVAGFWAAVIGYVVHLMFGLSVTGSTIMMWLALGVLLGPSAAAREIKAPSWRLVGIAVVVLAVSAGSLLNMRYISADMHYVRGKVLTNGTERVSEIQRAIELNPYNDMYRLELGAAWRDLFQAAGQQYAASKQSGTPDNAMLELALGYYTKATSAYESTIDYVPKEYDTYVFLSNLHNEAATYIDASYAQKAVAVAEDGIAVEKYGPAARLQLALAKMLLGRPDEAVAPLRYAISLDPAYKQAYMMLASAYREQGLIADARTVLEEYVMRFPEQADGQAALDELDASATTTAGQ